MTENERRGIDWWNGLTDAERGHWLRSAGTAVPAEAWAHYRAQLASKARAARKEGRR